MSINTEILGYKAIRTQTHADKQKKEHWTLNLEL